MGGRVTADSDEEYARGLRSGRDWAEHSIDREALDQVEALHLQDFEDEAFDRAFAVYMRCIDPEGNLAEDDIFDTLEAEGRALTSEYLFGFIDGAKATIQEMKARPAN
jgi:hypothetical protein